MVWIRIYCATFTLICGDRIWNGRNFLFIGICTSAISAEHLIIATATAAQWEITIATGTPLIWSFANKAPDVMQSNIIQNVIILLKRIFSVNIEIC